MKKHFFFISILLFNFLLFSQEAEIILPEVTTYIPASVEQKLVITAEDIEAAHYETLGELVERSGIQMLSYGPYGLESKPSVRGFTDETVRVVIDGICVNNAQYGTFDLSTINLAAVEKIEIVRGGFTEGVEDEGSVGGVIYITTKKQNLNNSLKADVSAKTYFNKERPLDSCFQKLAFAGRLGENTFLNSSGTLNYAENRYLYKVTPGLQLIEGAFGGKVTTNDKGLFMKAKDGDWEQRENAQVTDGHADANLTHYFGNGNYFSFGEIFYGGHKSVPGGNNYSPAGLQRDYNNNLSFTLWNPALAENFNLKNNLVWLCNNRFYKDGKGLEDSSHYINTIKYSGTIDFISLAGGRISQTAGISSDFTSLDSTNDGQHLQYSGVVKETTKFAAGGGWTFSLPLAVKFCVNDNNANIAFVPKAGLAWEHGHLVLLTDVYRMVQFPNMDDLFWEGGGYHGNPDLKPESGWGADIGFMLKNVRLGSGKLNTGLTVFSDYYKDKIRWASGTTENLSSAFYLGLDFTLAADFFNGFWTVDANGEYLFNYLLDENDELTYGKRIMWTPDFVCSVTNAWNFEVLKISLNTSYMGKRYLDNMNLYFLKPYLLLNLAIEGASIKERFTPYFKLDNILNWQYQSVDGYPMPGISMTLGAKYKFF